MDRNDRSADGDADHTRQVALLRVISQLEHSISGRQLDLQAAHQQRDAARRHLVAQRVAMKRVDRAIEGLDQRVHRQAGAVFLNGSSLDRGTLTLSGEAIRYSGWHGKAEARLDSVRDVEVGTSHLPPRAGVPILGRVRPGMPRDAGAILLTLRAHYGPDGPPAAHEATVRSRALEYEPPDDVSVGAHDEPVSPPAVDEATAPSRAPAHGPPDVVSVGDEERSPQGLMVLADLADAAGWRDDILERRGRLGEVAEERARLLAERQQAATTLAAALAAADEAQSKVDAIEAEIGNLRAQLERLKAQRSG